MSDIRPKAPYIYQPDPPFNKDGTRNERIYALAGPGAEQFGGKRFTRPEAEVELQRLQERKP